MTIRLSAALICSLALMACGENPQGIGGAKQDSAPYTGTGKPYAEKSWKEGDKGSWESQLKVRAQNGQNDYAKTN